jgi:hypothetical protein
MILASQSGYPDNGRTLTDDVVDLFFSIYANRKVTDKVGPHDDLLGEFPYLGPPHGVMPKGMKENL